MNFHFIGIGGAGMSTVAELLISRGMTVSGSDRASSATTERLVAMGARVSIGHEAGNVPADATVVVSTAIKESNPELAYARQNGLRVMHRSEALALAAAGLDFVAVAGAHGKTTTSAMVAHALAVAGLEPSWAIGSTLAGGVSGGHLGTGEVLVAEADESDGSFLNYTPTIEIVTNIEPDHLDHYGSREAFEQAFIEFAAIDSRKLLIACGDDEGAAALIGQAGGRIWSYGENAPVGATAHLRLSGTTVTFENISGTGIETELDGRNVELNLAVAGHHMLLNACAALAAGLELGVDMQVLADGLATFEGTGRRAEFRGEVCSIRVIDDYAHHPTEVRATLLGARGDGRLLVLFQPHLYSRTKTFASEFADALSIADEVVVTGVYGAREEPMDGVEGDLITRHMRRARFVQDKVEAAKLIASLAEPGDSIWTMGAGDVTTMAEVILEELT